MMNCFFRSLRRFLWFVFFIIFFAASTNSAFGQSRVVFDQPSLAVWHQDIRPFGLNPYIYFTELPSITIVTVEGLRGAQVTMYQRIKNFDQSVTATTPICVTDFTTGSHLGCIPVVSLEPGGTLAFRVTRNFSLGFHSVGFSYRAPNGQWQGILQPNHSVARAIFNVF